MSHKCKKMVERVQRTPRYVINLAHGLTPEHKPENVKVFVEEAAKASFAGYQNPSI